MNAPAHNLAASERHVLVVVLDAVFPARMPDADVLVVAPALNSWLRRWVSDEDRARRRAEERAAVWVERLACDGVRAEGRVGDADPLRAIADALATFPADEILIAAWSTASAEELAAQARERFGLPTSLRRGPSATSRALSPSVPRPLPAG
jgi:hypothetical protein